MVEQDVLTGTLWQKGFEVIKPLTGAGHAAIFCVREAKAVGGGETFVAKVVNLSGLDAKGRAAAMQEVSLLRGLAPHHNTIAYRESFMEDAAQVLLIVMSFAEDGDLHRQVDHMKVANRHFPESIVLWWFRQILSAVQHLHGLGVMHRDLKTSNVFLCENRKRIRVGDFGISRVLESESFAASTVGTPAYMSPELMRNERYDYHVDIWALGCVLYELCTKTLPFQAKSLLDLVFKVTGAEPDYTIWGDFSQELQDAVKRSLRKEADQRPTAAELLGTPLFAAGPAARCPGDDMWELLPAGSEAAQEAAAKSSGSAMSHPTSAGTRTTADAQSSEGGSWIETPPIPWAWQSSGPSGAYSEPNANGQSGGRGAAVSSERLRMELLAAKQRQHEYSKDEFQVLLSSYHHDTLQLPGGESISALAAAPAVAPVAAEISQPAYCPPPESNI